MAKWNGVQLAFEINMVMVILMMKFAQGEEYCLSRKQATFYMAQNRGLANAEYMSKKVASPVICVRDCHLDPECYSINYCTCSHTCVLNKANAVQRPGDMKEMQGSVYFDGGVNTPLMTLPDDTTCKTLLETGEQVSGIYTLIIAQHNIQAYCDMTTDGGGWVTFNRRQDGSVDFYRNWSEYQAGFGDLSGEFWLGNDIIRQMTEFSCGWELLVELEDWNTDTAWAKYGEFRVTGNMYTIHVDIYDSTSTAGNSLTWSNGNPFTTKDRDNDVCPCNCAVTYHGAWWYSWCHIANLNGKYYHTRSTNHYHGINWQSWTGNTVSLKKGSMKIREAACMT